MGIPLYPRSRTVQGVVWCARTAIVASQAATKSRKDSEVGRASRELDSCCALCDSIKLRGRRFIDGRFHMQANTES